ncbi:MAG: cyclic nucleotide-binding domain-containing protein [Firmicutes bacterium]|nr:cyclic nucleotide-binding domain-containing protein [Bacillota bacterium]
MNFCCETTENYNSDLNYNYIVEQLGKAPILSTCNTRELARVMPRISIKRVDSNELLYSAGSPAENTFFIIEGSVKLQSGKRKLKEINNGFIGEEAAIGNPKYIADAKTEKNTEVLVIPREVLTKLLHQKPDLKNEFYSSLLDHLNNTTYEIGQDLSGSPGNQQSDGDLFKTAGWIMAIIVPALVLIGGSSIGLDWVSRLFTAIFSSVIVMWVFRLSAEFVPSILAVLALVFLGIAPVSVVLSGFTSGSFFMALSVFGLAVVLTTSGITYRFVLTALKYVPNSRLGYALSLFLTGFLLTPVFPSANGRVSITAPLLTDMVDVLSYKPRGKAATQMAAAAFAGVSLFSGAFISSKAINFVVFGLLPIQVRDQFNWGYWAFASAIFIVVMFALYLLISALMYRSDEAPKLSKAQLNAQLKLLGPVSNREWAALIGILLFIVGIVTSSVHKIETPWIGLVVLYVFLALGTLSKKEFQREINWPFLIYLGGLIGLVKTMSYIGLDQWIGTRLMWMGNYMRENFLIFVLLLAVSIALVRIIIPNNATVVIFSTVFIPIAQVSGVNPWVIGFIILTLSDGWFMPYQCTYFVQFLEMTKKQNIYDKKSILVFNAYSNLARLAAVYLSIPYWRLLGIL